jgi:ubiquinone/menaquinone biosynthesis C-methylase UbiE
VPPRRPSEEALDDEGLPCEEMARSLRDLSIVNHRWGGDRALRRLLEATLSAGPEEPRLLDVGAGSGDIVRRLSRRFRRRGLETFAAAVDLQWRHLVAGRRSGDVLPAAAADGFRLPFLSRSFDWVFSTLLFHHFSPEENVDLLREFARVAREGYAVLDLRRHVVPLVFVAVAGRLVFESRVSVQDGMASVRQAYTAAEMRAIADRAVPGSRVERVFPFRLLIVGPPLAGAAPQP